MNIQQFNEKVDLVRTKKPILFELEADNIPSSDVIDSFEKEYGLVLPTSYKEFLYVYGGGYFAYVIVFSLDAGSEFSLKKNVAIEEVNRSSYLPMVDLETGDTLGFQLVDGECSETVMLYNHEDNTLVNTGLDFFETLCKYGLKL